MNNYLGKLNFLNEEKTFSTKKFNNLVKKITKIPKNRNLSQMSFDFNPPASFGTSITIINIDNHKEKKLVFWISSLKHEDLYNILKIPVELSDLYSDLVNYSHSTLINN